MKDTSAILSVQLHEEIGKAALEFNVCVSRVLVHVWCVTPYSYCMCQLSLSWSLAYVISPALSYLHTFAIEDTEVFGINLH